MKLREDYLRKNSDIIFTLLKLILKKSPVINVLISMYVGIYFHDHLMILLVNK